MKLVLRLTFALTLATCVVFAGYAYLSLKRQAALFDTDVVRDQRTLGRALAVSIASVWTAHGNAAAIALVERLDDKETKTKIRWLSLDADHGSPPWLGDDERETLARGQIVTHIERDEALGGTVYSYVPVVTDSVVGALGLTESLAEEGAFLNARIRRTLITSTLIVLVSALLALVLGLHFVARPIRSLVDKARRTGSGDFTEPLLLSQRDELGELATEMNSMARQLASAHARIERETQERVAALEQLRHAERLSTVGRLASGVAHELGTPLSVIAGRAQMISGAEIAADEIPQSAQIISEQTERMARIIRQLLELAHRRTPERSPTELRGLVRDACGLFRPIAEKRDVTIVNHNYHGAEVVADVDSGQIRQVVNNLVMNAIQASPPGSRITTHVTCTDAADVPNGTGTERMAVIRISDEGCGIEPDILDHIFEPFFTTKTVGKGTGLGLSVVYGIVQDHGGRIDVDTKPGAGTSFRIYLPMEAIR